MLHNRIGNIASSRTPLNTGSGIAHRKLPIGHITFAGVSGDVFRASCAEFFDNIAQGYIFVQSSGCAVKVYTTLADVDLALNPEYDSSDFWVLDTTTTAGQIKQLASLSTVVRIEFQGDGLCYLSGL